MTQLSSLKITLGFTDEVDHPEFEYQDAGADFRYVMRNNITDKATIEWVLYHSDFVGKWLDAWHATVTSRHCCLVTGGTPNRPTGEPFAFFDLNFVDLTPEEFERENPFPVNYLEAKHFSEFTYVDDSLQLFYPWYKSYEKITDDVSQYNQLAFHEAPIVRYQPLQILPAFCTFTMPCAKLSTDDVLRDAGYPEGFMRGNIQMGKLLTSYDTAVSIMEKYPRVCRMSISPVDEKEAR